MTVNSEYQKYSHIHWVLLIHRCSVSSPTGVNQLPNEKSPPLNGQGSPVLLNTIRLRELFLEPFQVIQYLVLRALGKRALVLEGC